MQYRKLVERLKIPLPTLKIDPHVHTRHSDSSSSVKDVLNAARQRGLDGIALTDHDNIGSWISAPQLDSDLLIIPGIEVTTKDGHLLLLGIKEMPPEDLDAVAASDYTRKRGGIVIVPHPKIPFISIGESIIERIRPDAIETYNAKVPFAYITRKSIKLAERLRIPQTGGSDAHSDKTVGDMYTVVEAEDRTVEAVLDAIKKGKIRPAGKTSSRLEKVKMLFLLGVSRLMFWRRKKRRSLILLEN